MKNRGGSAIRLSCGRVSCPFIKLRADWGPLEPQRSGQETTPSGSKVQRRSIRRLAKPILHCMLTPRFVSLKSYLPSSSPTGLTRDIRAPVSDADLDDVARDAGRYLSHFRVRVHHQRHLIAKFFCKRMGVHMWGQCGAKTSRRPSSSAPTLLKQVRSVGAPATQHRRPKIQQHEDLVFARGRPPHSPV